MSPIVTACAPPPCLAHRKFSHSSSLRPQFLGSCRWIHAPSSSLAGLLARCAQTFPPEASVFLPRRDSYASIRPLMSGGGNASRWKDRIDRCAGWGNDEPDHDDAKVYSIAGHLRRESRDVQTNERGDKHPSAEPRHRSDIPLHRRCVRLLCDAASGAFRQAGCHFLTISRVTRWEWVTNIPCAIDSSRSTRALGLRLTASSHARARLIQ